ncbi:hypothetical protein KUV85_08205 [Nocardioides panacisoli]|uniref:hypothetical protein n=1 Tax=Nocardioides panacisoli TaxID=627624 RepID=UPI001C63726F|nr:hypothetical protein [Nocardioides panacisoli]QYJ05648.1 hypothetical protein KUV85_08205 [Nocardioides panacisoli]
MTREERIEYAAWGELFFAEAVTTERVLTGVNVLAGQPIDVGPLGVGPGRLARVRARGRIGTATGRRVARAPLCFAVDLPVDLEFVIDLGLHKQRFDAAIVVPLSISVHARADLAIELDVVAPEPHEVEVKLVAQGLPASITRYAAGVERELCRFVARYVAREVEKPHVRRARTIDVSGAVGRAVASLGPGPDRAEELTEDLPGALETEIVETADRYLDPETDPREVDPS